MMFFQIALIVATFLCSLVAGFLFAFAVVAMPGIKHLQDGEYIRVFQGMDRVIQNNQPLFVLVWVGSILPLLLSAGLGIANIEGAQLVLLLLATGIYVLAVQLPTFVINVPLNNKLQTLHVETMDAQQQQAARAEFETRWNRSNVIRTFFACLVSVLLMILLLLQ